MAASLISLHDTADVLALDPVRLYRLGRYLYLALGDRCLPLAVVVRAKAEMGAEDRYRIVLDWLLDALRQGSWPGVASGDSVRGEGRPRGSHAA